MGIGETPPKKGRRPTDEGALASYRADLKSWITDQRRPPTQEESRGYIKDKHPLLGNKLIMDRIVRPAHRGLRLRTRRPR